MNDNWLICPICGRALNQAHDKSCVRCKTPIEAINQILTLTDKDETGYRDKANAGDAAAQAHYAYCLIDGKNVVQNKYLAKIYARRSAMQLNSYGMYIYAYMLIHPNNFGSSEHESTLALCLLIYASKYENSASNLLASFFRNGNYPLLHSYEEHYTEITNRNKSQEMNQKAIDFFSKLELVINNNRQILLNDEKGLIELIHKLFSNPLKDEKKSSIAENNGCTTYVKDIIYHEKISFMDLFDDEDDEYDDESELDTETEENDDYSDFLYFLSENDDSIDYGYRDDKDYSED